MDEKSVVEDKPSRGLATPGLAPIEEERSSASSKDLDDAYELYRRQDATDLDPLEARKVLRRIDWHILPLLMGTYFLQYLDKSSVNFASVFGLRAGTNLHGQEYAWAQSLFYFGIEVLRD